MQSTHSGNANAHPLRSPMTGKTEQFGGTGAEAYQRGLCPTIFEPYAIDVAARVPVSHDMRVLETAAGTGVVTRALLDRMPPGARLVATDLSEDMLAVGRADVGGDERLEWRRADAQALPFPDASFDVLVCQFGVMFFPDKALAMREAKRVLKPGGTLLISVWDNLGHNAFGRVTCEELARLFPDDPPTFFRMPFSCSDPLEMRALLEQAGFSDIRVEHVEKVAECESAERFAGGLVFGTPILGEVEARGTLSLSAVAQHLSERLAELGGAFPYRSPMCAQVATARA